MKKKIKPWGYEIILEKNNKYVVKKIFLKKNHQCSLQYHKYKHETIYVLSGVLELNKNNNLIIVKPGSSVTLEKNVIHRMKALRANTYYIECSTPQLKDIVRIQDDYNRI